MIATVKRQDEITYYQGEVKSLAQFRKTKPTLIFSEVVTNLMTKQDVIKHMTKNAEGMLDDVLQERKLNLSSKCEGRMFVQTLNDPQDLILRSFGSKYKYPHSPNKMYLACSYPLNEGLIFVLCFYNDGIFAEYIGSK
jgi:hypothetical protein